MSSLNDSEGLINLLQDCKLEPLPPVLSGKQIVAGPTSSADGDREWQDDSPAGKWNKIRSEFMNARTAEQVRAFAEILPDIAWLEMCTKMAPRQVDVNTVQITAVRIELPPAQTRAGDGDVIDIEVPG